jgi:hypothetical protein
MMFILCCTLNIYNYLRAGVGDGDACTAQYVGVGDGDACTAQDAGVGDGDA